MCFMEELTLSVDPILIRMISPKSSLGCCWWRLSLSLSGLLDNWSVLRMTLVDALADSTVFIELLLLLADVGACEDRCLPAIFFRRAPSRLHFGVVDVDGDGDGDGDGCG